MKHRPPRTPLLPFFHESSVTDYQPTVPAKTPEPTKVEHAVPNHRPRTVEPVSDHSRKPFVQQRLTFDESEARHSIEGEPFEDHQPDETPGSDPLQSATIQRSHGISGPRLARGPSEPSIDTRREPVVPERRDGIHQPKHSEELRSRSNNSYRPLFDGLDDEIEAKSLAPHAFVPDPVDLSTNSSQLTSQSSPQTSFATGDKARARDIIAAIRMLGQLDAEQREATDAEKQILARFGGFGPVALSLFPDPILGTYKDHGWQVLGRELQSLLSEEDYASAKRTTFNAFYTSPDVIKAMHASLSQLGVPANAMVLEPGCGTGNFLRYAASGNRFIGVELDRTSGRIAKALNPDHDIRIENFRDTKLPEGKLDAVIGNVPFANIKLDHKGQRFSLHDYFFAKSVDALKPDGVLALVTSHFTMDKQNASIREYLAERADFLGAIRLPAEAFKNEGTKVVTDIVFLKKRAPGVAANHTDPDWLKTGSLLLGGTAVPVNQYFLNHPEMVLGTLTHENQLYGGDGFSVRSNGDLPSHLQAAIARLPRYAAIQPEFIKSEPVPARFSRPPPQRHLSEGSFFIGEDQGIYQIEHGQSKPVMHGSTALRADGTMMAKRLAALITLRDAARLVLQAQNEAWPTAERESTRTALNQHYQSFVKQYGPINKTTFSQTSDGTSIRRMPNLVKFRDDPDAMLVMSLEDYDEVTGVATQAAIFSRDVVGPKQSVAHVDSAEEGLLVSLNERGGIDLPFIASLYGKSESTIIQELGELIYLNPESKLYETADVYLSGNVRAKLAIARAAGDAFHLNAEKLAAVQPPDVLPGDIDAKLGSPWIPASDVQAFAAELFGVAYKDIEIGHLAKDATWCVDPDYVCEQSVKATSEFGTPRANGTWLLELALNMKTPLIYDTVRGDHGDERVVNQDETLAAREKQKLIKERFRQWVFTDPERTERLVRTYNDTYNNLRPRLFDGSHLDFPGLNQTISLRPHQSNAIWRVMSSGNTLLAHTVGAGKTFTMAAAGMKLKQAGLVTKPIYVVPNHMLEQFSREFMQLYPNARLLVASKEDMSRDNRKFLTAKIASGNWDGIIVTHSSFERIGMSKDYQEKFLREQIKEYEDLLAETNASDTGRKHRNLIKTIEKQKANRENRLKELSAEAKKDDGLVFDELGVDHVFIDEAHYFKNLETPTKMDRVAGIQTGGSQRAFDIFMKSRYLDQLHPGHGVTFATGTPISNTMVELYNMQRFLDPKGLTDRGIEHFDAWAANFGEVVDTMEISPDGKSLRPRSRFAKFNNLPELQQMFRSFADVQTADMLNLPRPKLKTGQPITISCPMSEDQTHLQSQLIERYERIRSTKVDPRVDNALAITTDGRKLALDSRMLQAGSLDDPKSKINALVEAVHRVWEKSTAVRGTQLVFCDMGINPTSWGFSAYDDIIRKLIAMGIPRDQIASIGDAESDVKKQALFEKVRTGSVRVLIGSTQKMGTGTNVQKRLVALHHLDAPWKPAEVEQRDGRILRQGNLNDEVEIYRYVTQGSFDAYMWQALETKARFITQIMTGDINARSAEDIGGQELSYAEVKAIASGNPAVLTLAEADAELQRLHVLRKNHTDDQFLIRRKVNDLPGQIERQTLLKDQLTQDQTNMQSPDHPEYRIDGHRILRTDIAKALDAAIERIPNHVSQLRDFPLGEFHGIEFGIQVTPFGTKDVYMKGATHRSANLARDSIGSRAVLNALSRLQDSYAARISSVEQDINLAKQQLHDSRARLGVPFPHDDYSKELRELRDQLRHSLSTQPSQPPVDSKTPQRSTSEIAEAIQELKDRNISVEREKQSSDHPRLAPAQSITRQIKDRIAEANQTKPDDSVVETRGECSWQQELTEHQPMAFATR
jgi:N12 class adenine-specific DNA methylase/SAM-dependent methyltransferase